MGGSQQGKMFIGPGYAGKERGSTGVKTLDQRELGVL